jgi:hypothetical protein
MPDMARGLSEYRFLIRKLIKKAPVPTRCKLEMLAVTRQDRDNRQNSISFLVLKRRDFSTVAGFRSTFAIHQKSMEQSSRPSVRNKRD